MRATRRYWAVAGFGGVFVVLSVLFARPLLLGGAVSLGAWLLAHQYAYLRMVTRVTDEVTVEQSLATDRVRAAADVTVTLTARLSAPTALSLTATAAPPIGTTGTTDAGRTIHLQAGDRKAATTFTMHCPVAGTYAFDQPTTRLADPLGLFVTTVEHGPAPSVTVDPRGPRNIHVGGGGERVLRPYGEHVTTHRGPGLETTGVREYVPSDPARHIDWNATARHNAPHVREYDTTTDRTTALVIDHRSDMAVGPAHETQLDYARHLALELLATAQDRSDPIGLYTVGDDGITHRTAPDTDRNTYETIRRELHALTPTRSAHPPPDDPTPHAASRPTRAPPRGGAGDSAFSDTLRAYVDTPASVERTTGDPLTQTIDSHLQRLSGAVQLMVFTTDTHRGAVYDIVHRARDRDAHVVVFLTPRVLFDPDQPVDAEAAYDRYLEFEDFRRSLDRLAGVTAYEVGPGDRLDALITARQHRRHPRRQRPNPP